MKVTLKSLLVLSILLLSFLAYAETCDQGASGRQGPWPVYLVQPSQLLSKSNTTTTETPGTLTAHAVYTSAPITQVGALSGQGCAVALPAGFDTTDLVAACVPGSGTVQLVIYNTTGSNQTPTSGNYQIITF